MQDRQQRTGPMPVRGDGLRAGAFWGQRVHVRGKRRMHDSEQLDSNRPAGTSQQRAGLGSGQSAPEALRQAAGACQSQGMIAV